MQQTERIFSKPQWDNVLGLCLCAVFSCLAAAAELGGAVLPLPAALIAALPPMYALAALAGCLFTYFIAGLSAQAPIMICAAVVVTLARFMLGERTQAWLAAAAAGAGTLLSAVMFTFAGVLHGRDWLFWGIAAAVSVLLAYCGARVRLCCLGGLPLRLHGKDGLYCSVCYIAAAAALCSAGILTVSLGNVLIGFAVLSAAKRHQAVGGMICGTLSACAMLLGDGETAGIAVMLGIAGFAVGAFSSWRKGILLTVFQGICGIGLLLTEHPERVSAAWVSILLGGMLFICLPAEQLTDSLIQFADIDADLAALAGARMEFLSEAIADVRSNAERIAEMLMRTEPLYQPEQRVSEVVCSKCKSHADCWKGEPAADIKKQFRLLAENAHAKLPETCVSPERVKTAFQNVRRQNLLAKTEDAKLRDTQRIIFSQMQISEELLKGAAAKMQEHYDRPQSRLIADLLERFGIPVRAAAVTGRKGRDMTIELYLSMGKELEADTVREYLQEMLQVPLVCREATLLGEEQRIILQSGSGYEVETAAAQCAVHEDEPCGDCWTRFSDCSGNVYLVISDGMGTGSDAAVEARIVLRSFRQLVQSGMACEDAAKLVNAIMLTKSSDECFATLDIAKINTVTAEVTLYKYGAAPTLLRHGDHVTLCQATTAPIGILPCTEPYTTACQLEDGDLLLLLSDGLDDTLFPYIRKQLLAMENLQALVHAICSKAQRSAKGAPRDDVTVLAAAITAAAEWNAAEQTENAESDAEDSVDAL